jgi:hypothetical protein
LVYEVTNERWRRLTTICQAERLKLRDGSLSLRPVARRSALWQAGSRQGRLQELAELRDKLREAKDNYWSEIVDIQRQVAVAWLLHSEGKYDEAFKAMALFGRHVVSDLSPLSEKTPKSDFRAVRSALNP